MARYSGPRGSPWGFEAAGSLARCVLGCSRQLGAAVTNFQRALPIPAQDWPAVGSGFSGSAPPPSPPRPPEGLELPRGAFEPGAPRGSPPKHRGNRPRALRPEAHPGDRKSVV